MDSQEVRTVREGSFVGHALRPSYQSWGGVGAAVTRTLSLSPDPTFLLVRKVGATFELSAMPLAEIGNLRTEIAGGASTENIKITGVAAASGFTWTFDDGTDTHTPSTTLSLSALIDGWIDGDFTAALITDNVDITAMAANDWILIDQGAEEIHAGPLSAATLALLADIIANPDATLTVPPVSAWG